MEEESVVNGSHEPEIDPTEKILKPRKPKHSSIGSLKEHSSVTQNGNGNESGSVSDIAENDSVENGHVEDSEKDDIPQQNGNRSLHEEDMHEIKEGSTRKLRREPRAVKESTPKPETPMKRELRRRETTPRASTPKKQPNPTNSKDIPHEKQDEDMKTQMKENQEIKSDEKHEEPYKVEYKTHSESIVVVDESIVIVDESKEGIEEIVSIEDSVEDEEPVGPYKRRDLFSVFSSSFRSSNFSLGVSDSIEASTSSPALGMRDSVEAMPSSPSVICLGSPSSINSRSLPNKEIKGRKPINSFSKFPGRTVSIVSLDSSLKRKADDSFDSNEKKRFAGDIESGSEKSPGWTFSSWSPAQKAKLPQYSTPFPKRSDQDSMAVNYDEDTNLSFNTSEAKENTSTKTRKWCSVM